MTKRILEVNNNGIVDDEDDLSSYRDDIGADEFEPDPVAASAAAGTAQRNIYQDFTS